MIFYILAVCFISLVALTLEGEDPSPYKASLFSFLDTFVAAGSVSQIHASNPATCHTWFIPAKP